MGDPDGKYLSFDIWKAQVQGSSLSTHDVIHRELAFKN